MAVKRAGMSDGSTAVLIALLVFSISLNIYLLRQPHNNSGIYAEVVGTSSDGSAVLRFWWTHFNSDGSLDFGKCKGSIPMKGMFENNSTLIYFFPDMTTFYNVIGFNESATQLAYRLGAHCP